MLAIAAGARRRRDAEHNGRAWLAWHVAALQRTPKRLPKLSALMIDPDRPAKARTWRQQLAIARAMTGRA